MSVKVDVLISGAGPVGLYFGYLLASRGHSVYILDLKPSPTTQSRACAFTTRTMEILNSKGLADEVLYEATVKTGICFFKDGTQISQINSGGDTNFPFVTLLAQGKMEEIFVRRLEDEGNTRIHWETELVSYVQHDDHVVSTVRDMNTQEETTIQSTYIVGADGTHSKVRKSNPEWTYKGVALETRFVLADVFLEDDSSLRLDKGHAFMKDSRMLGLFDLNPLLKVDGKTTLYRLVSSLDDYRVKKDDTDRVTHGLKQKKDESPPTQDFVQQILDEMISPMQLKIKQVAWSSFFGVNERMANGFRRGRAFLIGDAAHCHSPLGGQGLNLGLQDADNLAWKMSTVLKGLVTDPEKLLNSYSVERSPHVESTIKATSSGTKLSISDTTIAHTLRAMFFKIAFSLPILNNYAYANLSQQTVTMSSEMIGVSDKGLLQAGVFLPTMEGLRQSYTTHFESGRRLLQKMSLQDILHKNRDYVAMFVTTGFTSTEPSLQCAEAFWTAARKYPVRRLIIQSNYHVYRMKYLPDFISNDEMVDGMAEHAFYCEERMDSPLSVTNRVGLYPYLVHKPQASPHALVIIRPDFYVAETKLIYTKEDVEKALGYFDSIF